MLDSCLQNHAIESLTFNSSGDVLAKMSVASQGRVSRSISAVARAGESLYLRRRRMATAGVALLALLLGYHVIFGQNGLTAFLAKRSSASQLDVQIKMLNEENERLRAHVDRLKDDPNAIEHEARESLHYTRPGEVIYTMPDKPKQ